jgi:hypothetical protein
MKTITTMLAVAAALTLGGTLPAAARHSDRADLTEEVRIPLYRLGQFRTFRADGRETLYIRASGRQWYRVTTTGPCPNLPWARAIGVDARGSRTLDRFSMLIVEEDRCPVRSVTLSDEPPSRRELRERNRSLGRGR